MKKKNNKKINYATIFYRVFLLDNLPKRDRPVRRLISNLLLVHPIADIDAHRRHIRSFRRFHVYVLIADTFRPMLRTKCQN